MMFNTSTEHDLTLWISQDHTYERYRAVMSLGVREPGMPCFLSSCVWFSGFFLQSHHDHNSDYCQCAHAPSKPPQLCQEFLM